MLEHLKIVIEEERLSKTEGVISKVKKINLNNISTLLLNMSIYSIIMIMILFTINIVLTLIYSRI